MKKKKSQGISQEVLSAIDPEVVKSGLELIEQSLKNFQFVVPIETLIPYENNPRDNAAAVMPVVRSLLECGWCNSIAVESMDNRIIAAGHTRLLAAQLLSLKVVPVKPLPHLSPDRIRLYRLLDNRTNEFSEWKAQQLQTEINLLTEADFKMQDFGFSDLEINQILGEQDPIFEGETNPEAIPPVKTPPQSITGKIYQLGRHRLLCGDATSPEDMARLLAGNSVDLWITDPPYNVDYSGKNEMLNRCEKGNRIQTPIENDAMPENEFECFLKSSFNHAAEALKPGGAFYIFHADLNGLYFRKAVKETGLALKQVLQWIKNNIVIGRNDYQWLNEPCLYGWKEGGAHYFSGDRKQRTVIDLEKHPFKKRDDGRFEFRIGNKIFSIAPESVIEEETTTALEFPKPQVSKDHPTMKPVSLFVYLIRNSSRRGEKILDTFAGSGTAILAAEQTNRTAFCMELEPHYCDVIRKRWAEFVFGEGCDWQKHTPEI